VLFEVITNIKMLGLKDLVNFASASEDGKTDIFAPQMQRCTSFMHGTKILSGS